MRAKPHTVSIENLQAFTHDVELASSSSAISGRSKRLVMRTSAGEGRAFRVYHENEVWISTTNLETAIKHYNAYNETRSL